MQPEQRDTSEGPASLPPQPSERQIIEPLEPTGPITIDPEPVGPKVDISSLYPTPVDQAMPSGNLPHSYSSPAATGDFEEFSFRRGYVIGRTIFWYSLIVGIVIVLPGEVLITFLAAMIATGFHQYGIWSEVVALAITHLTYIISYVISSCVVYYVLKKKAIDDASGITWLSFAFYLLLATGSTITNLVTPPSTQAFVNLYYFLSTLTVTQLFVSYVVVIGIGLLVTYLFSRLLYGAIFVLYAKIHNKTLARRIGIGVSVVCLIIIAIITIYTVAQTIHKVEAQNNTLSKINSSAQTKTTYPSDALPTALTNADYTDPTHGYRIRLPGWNGLTQKESGATTTWSSPQGMLALDMEQPSSLTPQVEMQAWLAKETPALKSYILHSQSSTEVGDNNLSGYNAEFTWFDAAANPAQTVDEQVTITNDRKHEYILYGYPYQGGEGGGLIQSEFSFTP